MDSLKPQGVRCAAKTYQDKNMEYIQRLSEKSRYKKENEACSLQQAIPAFNTYINGANNADMGGARSTKYAAPYLSPTCKGLAPGWSKPARFQTTGPLGSNSVYMESIKNAHAAVPRPYEPPPQQDASDAGTKQITLNYTRSYHKNDDNEDLAELDQFLKNDEREEERVREIERRVGVSGNHTTDELRMIKLANSGRRLEPEYIPESLFDLIDQIDECYDQSPSANYQPTSFIITDEVIEGPDNSGENGFQLCDVDSTVERQIAAAQPEPERETGSDTLPSPAMICDNFARAEQYCGEQKQTELNFYEDEDVIERNSFEYNAPAYGDCEEKREATRFEFYDEGEVDENSSTSRRVEPVPQFDQSMRNKMTITKEELYRLTQENYDDACLINCENERREVQTVKNTYDIVLDARGFINGELEQMKEYQAPSQASSKPQRSRKIVRKKRLAASPPPKPATDAQNQKAVVSPSTSGSQRSKQDRANTLMYSLKQSGIDIDDLTLRMNRLNQKQRMIILGVLKSIEKGQIQNVDDVKNFVAAEQPGQVLNRIEVNKKLPKPRRAKRILNTQVLGGSQLTSSHGKVPKDLKRK